EALVEQRDARHLPRAVPGAVGLACDEALSERAAVLDEPADSAVARCRAGRRGDAIVPALIEGSAAWHLLRALPGTFHLASDEDLLAQLAVVVGASRQAVTG